MAKTTNSVSPRRTKTEIVVSAAMAAALSTLTTAENIDISSIMVEVAESTAPQRPVDKQPVHGDTYPILTQDEGISEVVLSFTILYTKGKDSLGTDTIDIYSDLLHPAFHNATPLSVQHVWSPTGTVGDEEFTTDADESFLTSVPDPVGGTTSEKIKITYTLETAQVTKAVIT